jgi:hypothetical protein
LYNHSVFITSILAVIEKDLDRKNKRRFQHPARKRACGFAIQQRGYSVDKYMMNAFRSAVRGTEVCTVTHRLRIKHRAEAEDL